MIKQAGADEQDEGDERLHRLRLGLLPVRPPELVPGPGGRSLHPRKHKRASGRARRSAAIGVPIVGLAPADVAELGDAPGLGPGGPNGPWRFESSRPHQAFGPTNSSRIATESRRETEMFLKLDCVQRIPSNSQWSQKIRLMSAE